MVGSFEALRFIEAEEKRKNKAEKGKRREELEKRKTNLQPQFVGCKIGAFFTIKLGKKYQKWSISAHEMRCGPYIYIYIISLSGCFCHAVHCCCLSISAEWRAFGGKTCFKRVLSISNCWRVTLKKSIGTAELDVSRADIPWRNKHWHCSTGGVQTMVLKLRGFMFQSQLQDKQPKLKKHEQKRKQKKKQEETRKKTRKKKKNNDK